MHHDARGVFTEIFRTSWEVGLTPVQWNAVTSAAGVLRGVHVHIKHADYLLIVRGRASIGLRDLRRGSPTEGSAALIEMSGATLTALTIPPGIGWCPSIACIDTNDKRTARCSHYGKPGFGAHLGHCGQGTAYFGVHAEAPNYSISV